MIEFPLTKAKTAWGLLQDVKKRVLQVPEAIDMSDVLCSASTPCGTVGCLAGECCMLTLGRRRALGFGMPSGVSRMTFAETLLGGEGNKPEFVTERQQGAFEIALCSLLDAGSSDRVGTLEPGTKRYARAVVARVNRFMRKYEKRLRATKLAPVLGN